MIIFLFSRPTAACARSASDKSLATHRLLQCAEKDAICIENIMGNSGIEHSQSTEYHEIHGLNRSPGAMSIRSMSKWNRFLGRSEAMVDRNGMTGTF
jgi:hypothetical protein